MGQPHLKSAGRSLLQLLTGRGNEESGRGSSGGVC